MRKHDKPFDAAQRTKWKRELRALGWRRRDEKMPFLGWRTFYFHPSGKMYVGVRNAATAAGLRGTRK